MRHRAEASGLTLEISDAAVAKGMLARGDRQHDIAAWFGVNGGRVAEIATGQRYRDVAPAGANRLPPRGPYLTGRETAVLMLALRKARDALDEAERFICAS